MNPDGTKTVITFKLNAEGKKVKLTQKIREVKVQEKVHPLIAQRKNWAKYGKDKNSPPGPDSSTTQLGEKVDLRLNLQWKQMEKEEEETKEKTKTVSTGRVMCRTCHSSEHFTTKCPFKDTLGAAAAAASSIPPPPESGSKPGAYIPRHKRPDANGIIPALESRDDSTTLKVSQLNTMVTEDMIRNELFANFGPLRRVTLVKNKETGESRGFAYVAFDSEQTAQRVLDLFNGKGYMSLILRLEWSKKRKT